MRKSEAGPNARQQECRKGDPGRESVAAIAHDHEF
jgi:hypothetical protein